MSDAIFNPAGESLAGSFRRIGRIGFIIQLVIGALPIAAAVTLFMLNAQPMTARAPLEFAHLLTMASVATLVFTLLWFFLYIRLGAALAAGASWTAKGLTRRVWIGVLASGIGVVLSGVLMIIETAYLLYRFLETPQGGVPVIQTTGEASWISAIDMLSLMTLNLTLLAEIAVLLLGLLLLYRVSRAG